MSGITLDNGILRLRLEPDFGGRVSELTDLATGRNWLVPGPAVGSPDQTATFGVEQARGWDECFPSAAACEVDAWPMALRDHGEFWGRPVDVEATAESATINGRAGPLCFQRALTLESNRLALTYRVSNESSAAMPYLWSQHLLIAPKEGDRLHLPGIETLDAAFISYSGHVLAKGPVAFPDPIRDGLPALDQTHPLKTRFAGKFFTSVEGQAEVRVVGDRGIFTLRWNTETAGYLGLWLDYGGWPAEAPVSQISLAPTTAPMESLADAVAAGKAVWLQPGETREWGLSISIEATKEN
ncbi:MAG: hypothetical protein WA980_15000 [Shinella zoogloeoides]|uniref:hypothetical protein n=1 Tax=Shinella zoogloeoides TaxID=352475 RepID=UPI003C70ACC0